jgi:hypothetical protein
MLEEMMQKRREEHKFNRIDPHDNSIRTKKKGKIKQKLKNSTDDILHRLSSKLPSNTSDISVKSSMLPYMDSYFRIQESIKINDSLSRITLDNDNDLSTLSFNNKQSDYLSNTEVSKLSSLANPHQLQSRKRINRHISAEYLKKRYPRLFSCLKFQEFDLSDVLCRSDNWLIHFMEECYDDAISCCDKSANTAKIKNNSNRLDLGEMDYFPAVLSRFLSRTYSVMTIRNKICLEILVTLESVVTSGDTTDTSFGLTNTPGSVYIDRQIYSHICGGIAYRYCI